MDLQELEKEFKDYEVGFLALNEAAVQGVGGVLADLGLKILTTGPVRQINLSYPIKKHKSAFFGYYQFQALPDKIQELKNQLSFKTDILRFLIITPPIKKVPERNNWRAVGENSNNKEPVKPMEKVEEKNKTAPEILSNELLEQKLEEILQ